MCYLYFLQYCGLVTTYNIRHHLWAYAAAAAGSECGESADHTVLFRVNIPEPTSPGIETVVTSATLKLFRRRRHGHGHGQRQQHARSPTDDIVLVTVYQLNNDDQWRHRTDNNMTKVNNGLRRHTHIQRTECREGTGITELFEA